MKLHRIFACLAACAPLFAQNIPDRGVIFDPLADHALDTAGTTLLAGTHLFGEFGRYSEGSGAHHRWNAKTGGYVEFARWDSTCSIAMTGMMEMVADPFSDIGFNPRAIFWQEGVTASLRLGHDDAFTFGYMHRCKHDIDNLEVYELAGRSEQVTLVYSGITALWTARPRPVLDGPLVIALGGAVRNEWFLHLFDQRSPHEAESSGRSMNTLADAVNLYGRIDARPRDARFGVHVSADWMLCLFGEGTGFTGRWRNPTLLGSVPGLEAGFDLATPHGGTFTIFARGEWQRDGNITPFATAAKLFIFGIRASAAEGMW